MRDRLPPEEEIDDLRLRVRIFHRFSLFMLAGAPLSLFYWHNQPSAPRSRFLLLMAGVFTLSMLLKILFAARWQARVRKLERRKDSP